MSVPPKLVGLYVPLVIVAASGSDAVLNGGVPGEEYATHLLALARAIRQQRESLMAFPAPAMARPSSLERRFCAMLNARRNRWGVVV